VGDTVYCYGNGVESLIKDLPRDLSYLHRAASLEDVFLKLTGRDLRD
jgi:lipooligosaccharide transport system ATP-binding protein